MVRSANAATSGSVSSRAAPRRTSRSGRRAADVLGVAEPVDDDALGANAASFAPITSGESHSSCTVATMPSTSLSRRSTTSAVCGIGMPSGWRKRAVTANQSAMPPTIAASNPAARIGSHGRRRRGAVRERDATRDGADDRDHERDGADVAAAGGRNAGPRAAARSRVLRRARRACPSTTRELTRRAYVMTRSSATFAA
jgi:hypothetical protein